MSIRTARCTHRVLWFLTCPWCETEERERDWDRLRNHEGIFWRNVKPPESYRIVRTIIDRALDV